LVAVDLHLGAAVLREQHLVAGLDLEGLDLAVLVALAGADGDHLALDRLLLGGVGDEEASGRLLLLVEALDDHPVVQRSNLHDGAVLPWGSWRTRIAIEGWLVNPGRRVPAFRKFPRIFENL